MSMASKFGLGKAETILIGAKRIVKHFLSQTEKNPRLEILIQGKINCHRTSDVIQGHPMTHPFLNISAQSQFIDTDDMNQLRFSRNWEKHRKDCGITYLPIFAAYLPHIYHIKGSR